MTSADDRQRALPERADLVGDRLDVLCGACGDHHIGADLSESQRDRTTDALTCAGYQSNSAIESEEIENHSSLRTKE